MNFETWHRCINTMWQLPLFSYSGALPPHACRDDSSSLHFGTH